jgi:hypothetical protein
MPEGEKNVEGGGSVLIGGDDLPSCLVVIGLTDLLKIGGSSDPPAPRFRHHWHWFAYLTYTMEVDIMGKCPQQPGTEQAADFLRLKKKRKSVIFPLRFPPVIPSKPGQQSECSVVTR